MHIAHVTLAKKLGGGEMQQRLLMQALAEYPIEQSLICPSHMQDFFRDKPIANLNNIESTEGLFTRHCKINADIYHAHCGRSIYWCLIEKLLTKKPYIATRRVPEPVKARWSSRLAYGQAHKIVAITQAVANQLPNYIPKDNITICHSALAQNFQAKPPSRTINTHSPQILQIGNLLTHKGYQTTFECAQKLAKTHPNITITILGERRDPNISAQIDQHANINYVGVVDDPTPYYQQADLFIFPSWDEGMGSSLLEAMNHALPLIASQVGGIPEVIKHNQTGLLIPPQSSDALYDNILWMLDNPDQAQQLGLNGHNRLYQFLPQAMADTYFNIYQECLSQN